MQPNPDSQHHWVNDEKVDKEKLKQLAIALEEELETVALKSKDMTEFAKYEPLLNAIKRAKAMEIEVAEELPGMRHWYFETDLQRYISLIPSLSKFEFALECWRLEENKLQLPPPDEEAPLPNKQPIEPPGRGLKKILNRWLSKRKSGPDSN